MEETVDLKYDSRYTVNIKGEVTDKKDKKDIKANTNHQWLHASIYLWKRVSSS